MNVREYEKKSRKYKNYEHCKIAYEKLHDLKLSLEKVVFCDKVDEDKDVNVIHKEKNKKTYFESDEKLIKLLYKTALEFYLNEYLLHKEELEKELKNVSFE